MTLADGTVNQLAAPLFLFALLIVNEHWAAIVASTGTRLQPPKIQSMWDYTHLQCTGKVTKARKRYAMTAAKIVAQHFFRCVVVAPAGVCLECEITGSLDSFPRWILWLARMDPKDAVAALARSEQGEHGPVYTSIELEYNAGVAAAAQLLPALGHLRLPSGQGVLASRIATMCSQLDEIPQVVGPLQTWGSFLHVVVGHVDVDDPSVPQVCSAVADRAFHSCTTFATVHLSWSYWVQVVLLGIWCHTGLGPPDLTDPTLRYDASMNVSLKSGNLVQLTQNVKVDMIATSPEFVYLGPRREVLKFLFPPDC
jgi:hypothetical protein